MHRLYLLILICLKTSVLLYANAMQDFQQANNFYDAREYEKAIEIYQNLIDDGYRLASIYYNLGNAYFRNQELGSAVASYLAAKNLNPRDPDIKENLKFLLSNVKDNLEDTSSQSFLSTLDFWSSYITSKEILFFALIIWCLAFSLLLLTLFFRKLQSLNKIAWFLVILSLPFFFIFQISYMTNKRWGAVSHKKVSVHSGPSEQNTVVFELHEGAPVEIKDKRNHWYKIMLSNNQKGWLKADSIKYFEQNF